MSELTDKERIAALEQELASLFAAVRAWSDTSSNLASAFSIQSTDTLAHIKESSSVFGLLFVMLGIVASKSGISQHDINTELKNVSENKSTSSEVSQVISN